MKFPNQGEEPWAWWQPLRLRMEIRKHMNPITPDQAHRWKLIMAGLYFSCAAICFHTFAFKAGVTEHNPSDQDIALEHLNSGQIIRMENFKLKKVMDYRSEDFDSQIKKTNKPTRIFD